jgi:hypothetical protein
MDSVEFKKIELPLALSISLRDMGEEISSFRGFRVVMLKRSFMGWVLSLFDYCWNIAEILCTVKE